MNSKIKILSITLIIAVIIVFVLFLRKHEKPQDGEIAIRILRSGTTPSERDIVDKLTGRDIFKEEGVKLNEITGSAGPWNSLVALLSGMLDVAGGGWPGWINARARGGKIKAVLGSGGSQLWPGKKAGILVLENSSIHTIKDFAGKTIAVNVLGLTGDYVVKLLLKKNGIPLNQVQVIVVPAENQEQVLRSKQVDAVADTTAGGINFDRILDRGGVRIIPGTNMYDLFGEVQSTGTGFREEFIKEHPDVVTKYVIAVEKTRRIIWDEFQKDPVKVRNIYAELVKEKGGNPQLAKYYLPPIYLPRYEFITGKEIQIWIDIFESEGKLKPGQVKATDIYTNEFNPYYKEYVKKKGGVKK